VYYHVQVSRDSLLDTVDIDLNLLTGLNDTLTGLSLDTVYYWRVNSENAGGVSPYSPTWNFRTGIVSVREPQPPENFSLFQNYPNPFSDETSFSFMLPGNEPVQLNIYNVLGETIETAASGNFSAGVHTVQWDAKNLSSGLYYYSLQAGTFFARKSMMIIR
ncbi:MAG TPA: T9SS type A sorting domain-containing protein, partial [Candidatus Kapabacteria bacterium]|nr:T9SS type A sorting domain-containing protein [Candidatus Kapabacteria bacterium]